jgi:hypothetical protein
MRKLHALAVMAVSTISLSALGCSKGSSASGVTQAQGTDSSASACAAKMASFNAKAGADEKKAYQSACEAVSAKTQLCLASAKAEKDMDGCLTDKSEKEAFMLAVLGAAMQAGAASSTAIGPKKLDKLGLQIDVPGEAIVGDGIGANSAMVNSTAIGGVTIEEADSSTPKTLKAAKSDAQMFKPSNVQGDQLPDGYWLTFQNTGSMGTNYWVKTVHKIGKKTYTCEGVPDTADKAAAALAACKTLRSST